MILSENPKIEIIQGDCLTELNKMAEEKKFLTNSLQYDIILDDRRKADFLLFNMAQSRFGKFNRFPSINRNEPFLLEKNMPYKDLKKRKKYYKKYAKIHKDELKEYSRSKQREYYRMKHNIPVNLDIDYRKLRTENKNNLWKGLKTANIFIDKHQQI